ncbi:MAG: hypothetical protein HY040_03420 [Planctomycetes bacterium]|nr:hypothetical protein [Planctomycetota bacterium]
MAPRLVCMLSGSFWLALVAGCAGLRSPSVEAVVYEEPVFVRPVTVKSESFLVTQNQAKDHHPADGGTDLQTLEPIPIAHVLDTGPSLQQVLPHVKKVPASRPSIIAASLQAPDGGDQPRNTARQYQESMKPAPKDEPLVEAMRCILANQHQKAIKHLEAYEPETQEVFIRLLPVMAILSKQGLDRLTSPEIATLVDQLKGLMVVLRPRMEFVIDKMCCCDWIKSYGIYNPLPEGHGFSATTPARHGDVVHLYVELRNFASELRGGAYETILSSSLEIRPAYADPESKPIWFKHFTDRKTPLRSRTLLTDYYNHYVFFVPPLPPGNYTLVLQIADETRPERRVARKELEFRVNSVSARIP